MRKVVLTILVLTGLLLTVAFYPQRVQKPEKDGVGPLAVYIDPVYPAPQYHSPLDWWQTHHMDAVNRGDIVRNDCLYCHEPEKSCNNCHAYVGVDAIVAEPR